jgi:hypothetical protein
MPQNERKIVVQTRLEIRPLLDVPGANETYSKGAMKQSERS